MFHVSERKEYPTLALFSNENLKDALFLSCGSKTNAHKQTKGL